MMARANGGFCFLDNTREMYYNIIVKPFTGEIMAEFKLKTKNESQIKDKPRVYFTCHPSDFDKYFDRVATDIFKTQDCVIYYTADMTEALSEENLSVDIHRMNLVVVPVTLRLLIEDNRAMTVDIPYALEHGIPVLPLMMEEGIGDVYSRPDRFGERQFITPDSRVETEISYEKKLADFLAAILTSDEVARRVRAAFDAYIFLSYRKKDRAHANELMKLIHENPKYRDIAIWYDEFLSPGESFRDNIARALSDSRIFALLVTPNLLETPNFVMDEEYPAARESGKPILPVEMVETDREELSRRYDGVPSPVPSADGGAVYASLADMLTDLAIAENDADPEHNYLIGIAYLNGIDVEVDRKRGMELITSAAEMGHLEAIAMLAYISRENGNDPQLVKWTEKIYLYYLSTYGEEDPRTLDAMSALAEVYSFHGSSYEASELMEKAYEIRVRLYGEEHPDTVEAMRGLATVYGSSVMHEKSYPLYEKLYDIKCRTLGKYHADTVDVYLNNIIGYVMNIDLERALVMAEQMYRGCVAELGETHPITVDVLDTLASIYAILGNPAKARDLQEHTVELLTAELGEESERVATAICDLAYYCKRLGESDRAAELHERSYRIACRLYGEWHINTFTEMNLLIDAYFECGNGELGRILLERAYDHVMQNRVNGWDNVKEMVGYLSSTYFGLNMYGRAFELAELYRHEYCERLGEEHPYSIHALDTLAFYHSATGNLDEAIRLRTEHIKVCTRVYGETHHLTLLSMGMLANDYMEAHDIPSAISVYERIYPLYVQTIGREHPETVATLRTLADAYITVERYGDALPLYRQVYDFFAAAYGEDEEYVIEIANTVGWLEDNT